MDRSPPTITLVTGPVGAGKTAHLQRVVAAARARGEDVRGFVQERVTFRGRGDDYDLVFVETGERLPFLRRAGSDAGFSGEAWRRAEAELVGVGRDGAALLVVDELGRLEAEGSGHLPPLLAALATGRVRRVVAAARADRLAAIEVRLRPFGGLDVQWVSGEGAS